MVKYLKSSVLSLGISFLLATNTFPSVPQTINYQGRLTDAIGAPAPDAVHSITFKIYNVETGGIEVWDSGILPITTVGGLFAHQLGSVTPLPESVFADTLLWLGITVSPNLEMTPRARLSAAPYAHHSAFADSAGSAIIAPGSITAADVNDTEIQLRITGSAPAGSAITSINSNGTVGINSFGDITSVTAGTAMTGGGTDGAITLGVAANSLTAAELAANSVTASEIQDGQVGSAEVANNSLTQDDLATNSVAAAEIQDGTVGNAEISSSANIAVTKISGTAINATSTQTISGAKTFSSRASFSSDVQIGSPVSGCVLSGLGLVRAGSNFAKSLVIPGTAGAYTDWNQDFWQVNNQGSGAGGFNWRVVASGGVGSTPAWDMRLFGGSLSVTGNMHAVAYPGPSDLRYKKDIQKLEGSLANVIKLRGINYLWRSDEFPDKSFSDKPQLGFIAQEIQTVYPEFVHEGEDGYLSVDYSRLTPVLVEAIKEQQQMIQELQKQIGEMKNLSSELSEVKAMVQRLAGKSTQQTSDAYTAQ